MGHTVCDSKDPPKAVDGGTTVLVETLPTLPRRPVVLVVDREARVRAVLGVTLRQHGFAVRRAANAAEALNALCEGEGVVDVVLLESHLAGAESAALLEEVRSRAPRVQLCLRGGWSEADQDGTLGGMLVGRVPRRLHLDDLVRALWLLVASAKPVDDANGRDTVPADERRAQVRHACGLTPRCYSLPPVTGERWSGELQDVSVSGARVVLERLLEPGTILALELPVGPDEKPRRFVARVVRAAPAANGRWILGCAFARPLSEARLKAMLRHGPASPDGPWPRDTSGT